MSQTDKLSQLQLIKTHCVAATALCYHRWGCGKTLVLQNRCLGTSEGIKYICFIQILDRVWSCSGIKSAKLNSSCVQDLGTRLHISPQEECDISYYISVVPWPTVTLCPLFLSLFVHIFISYTLARQLNAFHVWSLFIQCNTVCNAMRPALQPGTISVAITICDVSIYCRFICLILLCCFLSPIISFSISPTLCLYAFPFCSHLFLFINIPIAFFSCLPKSPLCPDF